MSIIAERSEKVVVRKLTPDDWCLWKEIRLEALERHPTGFASSLEEESIASDEKFRSDLSNATICGLFLGDELVGVAGYFIAHAEKLKHKGRVFGVYLRAEHRGKGLASMLLEALIDEARKKVEHLVLSVVTQNSSAVKLYERHGFSIYGIEPRALKINGQLYDDYLMIKQL